MNIDILTALPEVFKSYPTLSILGRAQKKKLLAIRAHQLRDFTTDKHHKIDDKPFGGGPGMVLRIEPIYRAVKFLLKAQSSKLKARVILFSTRGKQLDNGTARRLAKYDHLILICGRYEGVDERVAKYIADEEISIGPYVLSGGELPALVLADAVSRHIPGVLGKYASLEDIKGSYPAYTKPADFVIKEGGKTRHFKVPAVLRSGHHKNISAWRERR